jgi:hypothetical protein
MQNSAMVACYERPNPRATDNWCVEFDLSRSSVETACRRVRSGSIKRCDDIDLTARRLQVREGGDVTVRIKSLIPTGV